MERHVRCIHFPFIATLSENNKGLMKNIFNIVMASVLVLYVRKFIKMKFDLRFHSFNKLLLIEVSILDDSYYNIL